VPAARSSSGGAKVAPAPATRGKGRPRFNGAAADVDREGAILDAAEGLFSDYGFYGVTVRQVAEAAGVHPSLPNYYFGSKRDLFDAVMLRRAEVVNAMRLLSMARYESETKVLTVEGSLEAFFEPLLDVWETGGPGWKKYLRLIAIVNNMPALGGEAMARYFDPVVKKLIELLRKVVPEARDEDLYWSCHFISATLSLSFAETGRIDRLSDGLCRSGDVQAVRSRLSAYSASGFLELTRRRPN
jgi:AcrR family transcriptional regulator